HLDAGHPRNARELGQDRSLVDAREVGGVDRDDALLNAEGRRGQRELVVQDCRGVSLDVPVVGGRGDDDGCCREHQYEGETHRAKRHGRGPFPVYPLSQRRQSGEDLKGCGAKAAPSVGQSVPSPAILWSVVITPARSSPPRPAATVAVQSCCVRLVSGSATPSRCPSSSMSRRSFRKRSSFIWGSKRRSTMSGPRTSTIFDAPALSFRRSTSAPGASPPFSASTSASASAAVLRATSRLVASFASEALPAGPMWTARLPMAAS